MTFIKKLLILRNLYHQLQRSLTTFNFFIHFNNLRRLYINIDVFKKQRFEVEIYHVKNDSIIDDFRKTNI